MIEYVTGKLVAVETQYLVVDHHGLGYQLFCPNPYVFEKEMDNEVKVFTYQYVKEDLIRLYGFQSKQERNLFEKLLNVSGIGPKGALAILASGQPEHVVDAIEGEDEAFLVKFPGVGKKTARQMILDLKGKLEEFTVSLLQPSTVDENKLVKVRKDNEALEEAFEALRALGYVEKELKKVRPLLEKEQLATDAYIRKALQLMLKV
ncbi:Holliday junction DNA helicase RuvA [Alkalihalobacillus alcalophilus ATCC 27647 = CGMCC 1.3604]|uniref:Holliday junction branch migration complex subunit RuvA n=1 Tax=Alkalihalobacillus alcalophilus ATCC 27647 = CGMCC 1.3604 TaxID=1218173 RepID=A0A094WI68_ALKAL|nr:Holliday junction branch migration protein RuvA [Alkalihalobacillus alcalophilus]KGA96516.1 ATP-dependent DNA helicase RuvA [Alkalihalobacillus alcalophilus ATCC 27647 = CGMCC 1.3604]MED1561263.1 Holliday junction branch migration protein RuvA [Alkalihalobacillus alcalophilus]THG89513.1 Holliday junction DNA helicase RuvA [Alkalihalobacillus alcalophilus ATCC 27647 = CGMCC 1.3604]